MSAYRVEEMQELLDENIPALSPTASKVIELTKDLNCSAAELTKLIKLDPVLAARVLRLVNSSYFSLSRKVTNLEKAVILLGLNTIKNLCLAAAALAQVSKRQEEQPLAPEAFWRNAVGTGVVSKQIAVWREVSPVIVEDYFVAGLLHNLGLLIESILYPDAMENILVPGPYLGLLEAEEKVLEGLNHLAVGGALGRKWDLADDLVSVMESYYDPDLNGPHAEMVLTVHVASVFCRNRDLGPAVDVRPVAYKAGTCDFLGMSEARIDKEMPEVLDTELKKAMEIVKA
jgi:HD-like signal output (HDOD) protein